ncbi:MAG: KPN_02809 family neutral zinc metallopeptidase [Arenicella sp.]
MRWKGRRQSSNVEDRRGMGGFGGMFGGGVRGGRRVRSRRKGGIGSLIFVAIIMLFFGKNLGLNFSDLLGGDLGGGAHSPSSGTYQQRASTQSAAQQEEIVSFVKVVLAETEDTWAQIFAKSGQRYRPPSLVLFDNSTPTACGTGQAASGPFYCPGDQKIYIDLDFMGELQRMGAQGDFAFAYVIAHEVAHHIQTVMGISEKVQRQKRQSSKIQGNALQVKMELQADCLAGLWANHTERRNAILEPGDIEEGINAAAAVGDDRISGGRLSRKHYTHGSSKERVGWFMQGFKTGDISRCDTFSQSGF